MEKLEIKQNWDFYMCTIEEKPASVRLNLALYNIAPIEEYKYRTTILVKMKNPDEQGLSSNEEFPILCDIEDAITEKIESLGAIFTGVVKSNGILEIYIFSKTSNDIEKAYKEALATFPEYEWKSFLDEDPNWDIYFNFLYPDEYSHQVMMNRRVVENLINNGDNLDKERKIDHWLYFMNEENRSSYIKEIEKLGYEVLSMENLEDGHDYSYQLNISRMDKAEFNHINKIVWELIEILKTLALNGYYDGWGCPIIK